jgi:hypothetical protein
MGKKSLNVKVDNLDDSNYVDVAYKITKTVKEIAPNSDISIVGATPETFEGSSNKEIPGK